MACHKNGRRTCHRALCHSQETTISDAQPRRQCSGTDDSFYGQRTASMTQATAGIRAPKTAQPAPHLPGAPRAFPSSFPLLHDRSNCIFNDLSARWRVRLLFAVRVELRQQFRRELYRYGFALFHVDSVYTRLSSSIHEYLIRNPQRSLISVLTRIYVDDTSDEVKGGNRWNGPPSMSQPNRGKGSLT